MTKKKNNNKPLTLNDLVEYNNQVLFPALDKRFDRVDKRFDALIGEMTQRFEEANEKFSTKEQVNNLTGLAEKVAKGIQDLQDEKASRDYQLKRERQWRAIITQALLKHKILSQEELEKISKLNIF